MRREKPTAVQADDSPEASFVSRWSRLKHEAAKDAETAVTKNIPSNNAAGENTELEAEQASSTRILTDEDMPDIESLTPDSVYADFLSPGVSEELRKLALRKLFHGEAFNLRDGLDEYDGDYTQFEKLGDIVTADMQHQLELEAQRKAMQLLQNDDQSSDEGSMQGIDTHADPDESADEDNYTAVKNNAQPDAEQKPEDAERVNEAVADAKPLSINE